MISFIVTKGKHEIVPKDIREEAEKYAKVSKRALFIQFKIPLDKETWTEGTEQSSLLPVCLQLSAKVAWNF